MGFKNVVLCALLLASASVSADSIGWGQGQGRPGQPGQQPGLPQFPNQPNRPTQPNFPNQPTQPTQPNLPNDPWGNGNGNGNSSSASVVEENVQRYFDRASRLDLIADSYIRSQLQGSRIQSITIVASTEQGQGQASLVLNGQSIESSKIVARQMAQYNFRVDPFANVVGLSLRSIELSMQGRFYVEKFIFNLRENSGSDCRGPCRPPESQVEVVRQQLNERIQQEGGLELFRMFNLGMERQGQIVKRVTVVARSARGMGQASLMVNNQQASSIQNISFDSTRLSFDLSQGMRIGQEIQGLRLYFRGDITVDEVSIEIEKRGGGQIPPSQERRFEQLVNQRLYDTSGVDLRSLMQIPSRFDERVIESVELVLRNSDIGVSLKLCQVIQDRFQSVNCAAPTRISSGAQVVRLSGINLAKLRETTLSTRMGMVDIDRIAINFR